MIASTSAAGFRAWMPVSGTFNTSSQSIFWRATMAMRNFAMHYRQLGWSIIPQRPGGKSPLVRWKPFQESPPTFAGVERWWAQWPEAGICLILGPVSGVVAVDVDSEPAHHAFRELLGGEPQTLMTLSGSRLPYKAHYLYLVPEFATKARFTPLHPQLEFRGHGGYVVLPPSLHKSGNRYAWVDPRVPIAPLPERLAAVWCRNPRATLQAPSAPPLLVNNAQHQSGGGFPDRWLRNLPDNALLAKSTVEWLRGKFAQDGGWNARLFKAACDLAGLGLTQESAEPLLLQGASPNNTDDEQRARATIRSAYAQPRQLLRALAARDASTNATHPSPCPNVFLHRPRNRRQRR